MAECPRCGEEFVKEYLEEEEEDDIPAGCVACGGPYPDCMTSCSIFDD